MAVIIYSKEKIDGLDGRYINPVFYNGIVRGAKKVYTDHLHIREAYEAKKVEVLPITVKKTSRKKA